MALRIGNYVFAPRVVPTLVTLALLLVLLGLGRWQLARMAEKQVLFAEFAATGGSAVPYETLPAGGAERYQHVTMTGHFDSAHQVLLDNMTHLGQAGFRVLTPFVTRGERTVLVDRGWIAMGPTRDALPAVDVSEESRTLKGRLDDPPAAGIELPASTQSAEWPRVMNYPQMSELQALYPTRIEPRLLLLDADQPDGFVREWQPSTFPPERHLGYAITWFTLAATLLAIYISANLRRAAARP